MKFPEERAYKEFLSKNGGSSNAGTGMESTVYKFEINSMSFPHSLDLFSQFFKQPLFTEDAIAREVMAVDAEDSKNRIIEGKYFTHSSYSNNVRISVNLYILSSCEIDRKSVV